MTNKVPQAVLESAHAGRTVIPVGRQGKFWRAYKRPPSLTFTGDLDIELVAPNGKDQFLVSWRWNLPPLIIRLE